LFVERDLVASQQRQHRQCDEYLEEIEERRLTAELLLGQQQPVATTAATTSRNFQELTRLLY